MKKNSQVFIVVCLLCATLTFTGCQGDKAPLPKPTPRPTPNPTPTPRYTEATKAMLALNYCHLSLVKILAYEDRIILHEEYDNIINNINLAMINDEEIITVLKNLMDTLTEFKLAETERELFVNTYNKKVSTAFYEALANSAKSTAAIQSLKTIVNSTQSSPDENFTIRAMQGAQQGISGGVPGIVIGTVTSFASKASKNPISAGIAAVVSVAVVGDIWQSYHANLSEYRGELNQNIWRLEKGTIERINELRKSFLDAYWRLIKRYNIPDEWRLSEEQLQRVVQVFQETDSEKRLRQLTDMEHDFLMFPPFWYMLARTYHETGQFRQALALYQQFEDERFSFFRQDHELSSALMNKILLVQSVQALHPSLLEEMNMTVDIPYDVKRITANSPYNWQKNLFAALQYITLGDYAEAEKLLRRNIDNDDEISVNTTVLGEMYAFTEDDEKLTALIKQVIEDERSGYKNALYLVGTIRDGELLKQHIDDFIAPQFHLIESKVDHSIFGNDSLLLTLPDDWIQTTREKLVVNARFIDGRKIFFPERTNNKSKSDTQTFLFSNVFDEQELIRQKALKILLLKMSDGIQTLTVRIDATIEEISTEGLFSDGTESVVVFRPKELKTVNACYGVGGGRLLERLSQCSFDDI